MKREKAMANLDEKFDHPHIVSQPDLHGTITATAASASAGVQAQLVSTIREMSGAATSRAAATVLQRPDVTSAGRQHEAHRPVNHVF
jgi:hypothetical protein